jgi:peptidoglycan/xylan/chitin deacetylase (PgdA/CDA1 family)
MKKIIKDFLGMPFNLDASLTFVELIQSKNLEPFIISWHDLPSNIFKEHILFLKPYKPIPLDELIKRKKDNKSIKGCFAITFDDGVETTVKDISNVCMAMNWPVTFYLPTNYINGESLPFQKVEFIKTYLSDGKYSAYNKKNYLNKNEITKPELIKYLQNLIYFENAKEVKEILDYFVEKILENKNENFYKEKTSKPISWKQIREISSNPMISFQSHGVTHTAVSALKEQEIEQEMKISKRQIEEITNKRVHSFCYPYGNAQSINNVATNIAKKYFESATTLIRGRLKESNDFYLPRIDLHKNDSKGSVRLKLAIN